MENASALSRLTDQPVLDGMAEPVSRAVRGVYESAGEAGRQAKNAMHGVWLGHPLHPALVAVPIGAWTTAVSLDVAAAANNDPGLARAADFAIAVGLVGAVGSAITGLTDWSETSGQARRTGLVHGLLNVAATGLFAVSYLLRKTGSRAAGQACSATGLAAASAAGYLGGALVFDHRLGVTHADANLPEEFTAVADSASVADGAMTCARAGDANVLLARQHGRLCALAHACSHLGGPLSEGTLKDGSVVCPWHGSEFALDDGHVINGPATQSQPVLAARERGGRIEVKEGA